MTQPCGSLLLPARKRYTSRLTVLALLTTFLTGCLYIVPPAAIVAKNTGGSSGGAPVLINDNSEALVLELKRSTDTIQPIRIQVNDPEGQFDFASLRLAVDSVSDASDVCTSPFLATILCHSQNAPMM